MEMNDIHVTINAVLGMLLVLAVVFDIYLFIDNSKLCKSDAEHKLEAAEWKEKYDTTFASLRNLEEKYSNAMRVDSEIHKVEQFVVEPIVLKSRFAISDYISIPEDALKRQVYEEMARGMVQAFYENPTLLKVECNQDFMNCAKTYQASIRVCPYDKYNNIFETED